MIKALIISILLILLSNFNSLVHAQNPENLMDKINTIKTFQIEATINAPIAICWNAWTDVGIAKQWLGATFIGTKAGDDYRVSTIIPYLSGRHKIIEIVPQKSLKLKYFIDGWPAEVSVKFDKIGEQTKLTFDFSVDIKNAPEIIEPLRPDKNEFYFIRGSWNHVIFRLRGLLEDRHTGVVIEPKNNDHHIKLSVDIKSTPEKIYSALINLKQLKEWAGTDFVLEGAEIDPKVGGILSYGWYPKDTPEKEIEDGPSKILKLVKNKLLVHNWHGGNKIAEISWNLEEKDNETTRLTFTHSPILGHTHGNVWSYRSGWSEGLYCLKWYAERNELSSCWIKSD